MEIDFHKLYDTLFKESKTMFSTIIKDLSHENIYSVYLSMDSWSGLYPGVGTKIGLNEVAKEYKKDDLILL